MAQPTIPSNRRFLLYLLLGTAVVCLGYLLAFVRKDDAKKLQGTWEVVSFEARGDNRSADAIQAITVTFLGDEFVFSEGETISATGHFKLDPSQKPKSLDCTSLVVRKGKSINETAPFIYDLDGDTLKLCWRKPGGNRPTEFTAIDTDGLMTLKKR